MIKIKAQPRWNLSERQPESIVEKMWKHSIYLPNIPYLSQISYQICKLTLIDKTAFYDIYSRKN